MLVALPRRPVGCKDAIQAMVMMSVAATPPMPMKPSVSSADDQTLSLGPPTSKVQQSRRKTNLRQNVAEADRAYLGPSALDAGRTPGIRQNDAIRLRLYLSLINAGLAQAKGRSGLLWWLASLFFGPAATFLVVVLAAFHGPLVWSSRRPRTPSRRRFGHRAHCRFNDSVLKSLSCNNVGEAFRRAAFYQRGPDHFFELNTEYA